MKDIMDDDFRQMLFFLDFLSEGRISRVEGPSSLNISLSVDFPSLMIFFIS